jgi:hypothetical protein
VDNFRPTVTINDDGGELIEMDIDLSFTVEGTLYFTGDTYDQTTPFTEGDLFEESELMNPDHNYMLVVPAGEVTLQTIVTDRSGAPSLLFQPDETEFEIGPGCVKNIKLKINQAGAGGGSTPGSGGGGGVG